MRGSRSHGRSWADSSIAGLALACWLWSGCGGEGSGLLFARIESTRLVDVVRVGAEGVTRFTDGFELEVTEAGSQRISGESRWSFEGDFWLDESCEGRSAFAFDLFPRLPKPHARDLHFVLRWPATSSADLDLLILSPGFNGSDFDRREFLGEVYGSCHVLHSSGTAGAAPNSKIADWVHPLSATPRAYHEEIIRCGAALYGDWYLDIANWSPDQSVDFEIEVFEGASLGIDAAAERAVALHASQATPQTLVRLLFNHRPAQYNSSGSTITLLPSRREPAPRPRDPLSHSLLGFNKAVALDVPYDDFLANQGLPVAPRMPFIPSVPEPIAFEIAP
jgi:hypothetical protein